MSKPFRTASAVSFIALASMISGCATPQNRTAGASHFGGKVDGEVGLATRAVAALNSGNVPMAIELAERAVAKTPNDAGFRALLGNAYFAGGRFWSAEAAYKDSLSIYSNQPQVVLKLALVEIALGKKNEAVAFLDAGRSVLNASDYGLAMALAGRVGEAVAVLEPAARDRSADATVRQNLALAYALSGDWTNARTVAAQDVPANQLDSHIQQWMLLANPGKPADQVAKLVGVTPAAVDRGQPLQLALHRADTRQAHASRASAAPVQAQRALAPAAPVATAPQPRAIEAAPSVAAVAPPAWVAETAPPPVPPAPEPQFIEAVAAPAEAPVRKAVAPAPPRPAALPNAIASVASTAVSEAKAVLAAVMPQRVTPAPRPAKAHRAVAREPQPRRGNSTTVVQLGAYGSPERVLTAWDNAARKHAALKAYMPVSARFASPKGVFYRLSVRGFAGTTEANQLCSQLRRQGGSCFVRNFAGDTPVQYASR